MVISIIVASKVSSSKNGFNILLVTKMLKRLELYAYFFQTWIYIEDILIKLDTCLFW